MRQIVFILHGKLKNRDKLIAETATVFGDSASLIFKVTEHADHAIELACNACFNGSTHIICVGGDGSLNEVANGVMLAVQTGLTPELAAKIRIGILPHGTGNDFARTMKVSYDLGVLKQLIEADSFKIIDIGKAEYLDRNFKPAVRCFVNISDVGIGGTIAQDLSTSSKTLGSFLTYQKGILKALLTYKNQQVRVVADTFSYDRRVMSLIVANGKYFGGGMGIAPDAEPDDKLFSIVIIGEVSMFTYIRNLGNIRKSRKMEHPELKYLSAADILIDSPAGPLPIDMDGEFIGFSPVRMVIMPMALKFIAPK